MGIRDTTSFDIGGWRVTPEEDTVSRDGHLERLEPLAMQVLVYLASRAGEVVSRSDLEEAVWKGGVVSYDSVTSTVIKLRKALGDDARRPSYIATIPKRGYQLIAPVSSIGEQEAATRTQTPGKETSVSHARTSRRRLAAILMADMVDYSRRLETDEAGTIVRFNACVEDVFNPSIEHHGGRTVRLAGDGALIEFPSAVEATQCAIDIQRGITTCNQLCTECEQLAFRMGISIGDVIEDADNLHGSGINIAARLEGQCKPGHILLSDEAAGQVNGRVDAPLHYVGERRLKNIERKIRVWTVDPGVSSGTTVPRLRKPSTHGMLLLMAVLIGFAGLTAWLLSARTQAPAGPTVAAVTQASRATHAAPVLAVLPFVDMSGDMQQNYLGDGIAEDLITDLSRLRNLTVIARSSSFRYRGKTAKAQDVREDLGVSHLLEGSVRRAGDRLRVAAQLVDAETGHQLWAERYDRVLDDVFKIQDEITRTIVTQLSVELASGESERIGLPKSGSFAAYEVFLKGMQLHLEYTRESNEQSQSYYRESIALDPAFGRAYGALAVSLARGAASGWYEGAKDVLDQALALGRTAVQLDPYAPQTNWALGYVYHVRGEPKAAISAIERSVELAPNYADGYGMLALISNSLGEAEDAIKYVKRGMVLNPFYSWDYNYNLGRALYIRGDYAAAVDELQNALERNSTPMFPRIFLTAALVELKRLDDAEWQVLQLETDHPELTVSSLEQYMPLSEGPHKTRLLAHLRTAGMAE